MRTTMVGATWHATETLALSAELRRSGLVVPYPIGEASGLGPDVVEQRRSSLSSAGAAVDPLISDLIDVIQHAGAAVDLRFVDLQGHEFGGLAVFHQDRAAVIAADGDSCRFAFGPSHGGVAALLSLLPHVPPTTMVPLALPGSAVTELAALAPPGGQDRFAGTRATVHQASVVRRIGLTPERIQEAISVLGTPLASGQIGATFDAPGGGRRAGQVVGIYDCQNGRVMVTSTVHPDGEQWMTIAPATGPHLLRAVAGLLSEHA